MKEFGPSLTPDPHCPKKKIFNLPVWKATLHNHSQQKRLFMLTNQASRWNAASRTQFYTDSFQCARKASWFAALHLSGCWQTASFKANATQMRVKEKLNKRFTVSMYSAYSAVSGGQSEMQSPCLLNKCGSIHCGVINRKPGDSPLIPCADTERCSCKTSREAVIRGPMKCRLVW